VLQGIRDVTVTEWDRVVAVNLKGIVFSTEAALPHFEAHQGGSIMNLSSIGAQIENRASSERPTRLTIPGADAETHSDSVWL
jgi:NADP-dependent 3-hydroxy acid dehydrogenase YdfG